MGISVGRDGWRRRAGRVRPPWLNPLLTAVVLVFAALLATLAERGRAGAQEPWAQEYGQWPAAALKVDLVVPATVSDEGIIPSELCVYLPEEARTLTVWRRPLFPEAGGDRPLQMTIRPYIATAYPLVENASIVGGLALTLPDLGYETCFSFENRVSPREAQGVNQAYKYFAQVASLEVR